MSTILYILSVVALVYILLDIWKGNDDQKTKIIWTLIVVFTSWLGIIIYWFMKKNK